MNEEETVEETGEETVEDVQRLKPARIRQTGKLLVGNWSETGFVRLPDSPEFSTEQEAITWLREQEKPGVYGFAVRKPKTLTLEPKSRMVAKLG